MAKDYRAMPSARGRTGMTNKPAPGTLIIFYAGDHSIPDFRIARVVKPSKVMWEVELWWRGEWDHPARRQVLEWYELPPGADPGAVDKTLRSLRDEMWAGIKSAKAAFVSSAKAIASGGAQRPEGGDAQ